MVRNFETKELIREIEATDTSKGKDILLTFWQISDNRAELWCSIGHGLGIPVIHVWEINLENETPREFVKEAQKLKASIKRHFKNRTVTSDFRW